MILRIRVLYRARQRNVQPQTQQTQNAALQNAGNFQVKEKSKPPSFSALHPKKMSFRLSGPPGSRATKSSAHVQIEGNVKPSAAKPTAKQSGAASLEFSGSTTKRGSMRRLEKAKFEAEANDQGRRSHRPR